MLLGFVGAARVWCRGAQVLGDCPVLNGFCFLLECNMFPDLAESEFGPDSFSSIYGKPICFLIKLWVATPLFIMGMLVADSAHVFGT